MKINEFVSDFFFFCDPLEEKIVYSYIIKSGRSSCAQLQTSTPSRFSISGLGTKRLTSTLNDIMYYFRVLRKSHTLLIFR
jgi:hypothetical protein